MIVWVSLQVKPESKRNVNDPPPVGKKANAADGPAGSKQKHAYDEVTQVFGKDIMNTACIVYRYQLTS